MEAEPAGGASSTPAFLSLDHQKDCQWGDPSHVDRTRASAVLADLELEFGAFGQNPETVETVRVWLMSE
jgi:hypothetical protein